MNNFKQFVELHKHETPLVLGNIWDVVSAKIFEQQGFKALGTSSAAVANMLGYDDGEEISFSELEYIVRRIITNISVPLSVDLEGGYSGDPSEIISYIERLHQLGVVGINIEDSLTNGKRELKPGDEFADIISTIKKHLLTNDINIFVNVRTDPFLLGNSNAAEETLKRIPSYETAGADGIFVPGITEEHDIKSIVSATQLPVNVMCMPELPSFQRLNNLGVKRISMGPFLHRSIREYSEKTIQTIQKQQSFEILFKSKHI